MRLYYLFNVRLQYLSLNDKVSFQDFLFTRQWSTTSTGGDGIFCQGRPAKWLLIPRLKKYKEPIYFL